MKNGPRVFWLVAFAVFSLSSFSVAQVSTTLTSPGSGASYDGIYVSPYYATVGGVANTPVVCDDFGDESWVGSSWNASVTSFSNISGSTTAWGNAGANLSLYGAVGYLTQLVLSAPAGSLNQIIDTYALWAVFDPSGVESYLASHPITAGSLTTAQLCDDIFGDSTGCSSTSITGGLLGTAEKYGSSQFANLEILSPMVNGAVCTAESGNCPAQEFIVEVPEGGSTLAYLALAGFCCLIAVFRSRRMQRLAVLR